MKNILTIIVGLMLSFTVMANEKTILILGDSLTEGEGVNEEEAFPKLVEDILIKKHKVKIINGGISGATSASGLQRLKWHLKKKVDILALELGANDGLRGLDLNKTKQNLKSIIAIAKEKNVKVLMLGVLMPPNYGVEYTSKFKKMYEDIVKEEKIPFLPFVLEGVAGVSKYNLSDGIHPNPAGHKLIAERVATFLEGHL
jgi:acyl-CoA thioesterase-1